MDPRTEHGFREFYETEFRSVLRLCRLHVRDHETAEDLCQEAFARAYRARASLREPAAARGWMLRIATNVCREQQRKGWLRRFLTSLVGWEQAAEVPSRDAGPHDRAEEREELRRFQEAVSTLPARERSCFGLVALQGLSYAEVADVEGCTQDVARQAVCRARRRLRARLSELEAPSAPAEIAAVEERP